MLIDFILSTTFIFKHRTPEWVTVVLKSYFTDFWVGYIFLMFLKGHSSFLHAFANRDLLHTVSRKRQRGCIWAFLFWLNNIVSDHFSMLLADTGRDVYSVCACILPRPRICTPCMHLWVWGHPVKEQVSFLIVWNKSKTRDVSITDTFSRKAYASLITQQSFAIVKHEGEDANIELWVSRAVTTH